MDENTTLTRGERTRSEIMNAAQQLFVQNGYHGASMRQIAQQADVALGGIYNHFYSKEQIFLTVLTEMHPLHYVLPLMATAQGSTIEEFVREAAKQMVTGVGERLEFVNLIFIELVEFKGEHLPQIFNIFFPRIMEFAQHIALSYGELRPIPLPVLVRAYIGLFFSYIMTELLLSKQLPPEMGQDALDHFVDIFLHGILVENPSPAE